RAAKSTMNMMDPILSPMENRKKPTPTPTIESTTSNATTTAVILRCFSTYSIDSRKSSLLTRNTISIVLFELPPSRVIDNDRRTVSKGPLRVASICRYNRHHTRPGDMGDAFNGQLELALNHLIDFFLRMEMLVNGGAALEFVVRDGHVL